jgi:geranylgeranyl pyrophosphate synthase
VKSQAEIPAVAKRECQNAFECFLRTIRPEVHDRITAVVCSGVFDERILPLVLRGKRLRAGVLLLVHDTLAEDPGTTHHRALDLACALELAHTASLIVDDMIDGDVERRGLPAVHVAQGQKAAMLDAIGILAIPYGLVAPHGSGYAGMLARAHQKMTFGILHEMRAPQCPDLHTYTAINTLKSGCLFGLASAWGYLAALHVDVSVEESLHRSTVVRHWQEYGVRVGRCLQVADDIADLGLAEDVPRDRIRSWEEGRARLMAVLESEEAGVREAAAYPDVPQRERAPCGPDPGMLRDLGFLIADIVLHCPP